MIITNEYFIISHILFHFDCYEWYFNLQISVFQIINIIKIVSEFNFNISIKIFLIIQKTNAIHPKLNIYNPSNNETNFQFSIISSEYRKEHENWYKKKKSFIKFHNPMEIEIEFEIDREIRKGKRDLAENSINNFHLCILKIVRFNLSFSLLRQYFYNFWNVRKEPQHWLKTLLKTKSNGSILFASKSCCLINQEATTIDCA